MKKWKFALGAISVQSLMPLMTLSCNEPQAQELDRKNKLIEQLHQQINELNQALGQKQNDLTNANKQLLQVNSNLTLVQEQLVQAKDTNASLVSQVTELNGQNKQLNEQLQQNASNIADYQTKINRLQQQVKELQNNQEYKNLAEQIKELNKQIVSLQETIKQANDIQVQDREQIETLKAQLAQSQKDKNNLEQALKAKNDAINQVASQLQEAQEKVKELTASNEELQATIEANNATIKQNNLTIVSLKEQIKTNTEKVASLQTQQEQLNKRVEQLLAQLASAKSALEIANSSNATLQEQNAKLLDEIAKLKKQISDHSEESETDKDRVLSTAEIKKYYQQHPNLKQFKLDTSVEGKLENNKAYISSILNRTFSLIWDFNDGTNTAGTIWLLDYHKESDTKYKLFFATNYHVAAELYSDKDFTFNAQPNRKKSITNIRLGAIDNWTNKKRKYSYKQLNYEMWPKNLFLAHNFMDQKVSALYQGRYYTEFSVIEFDYDIAKFNALPTIDPKLNDNEKRVRIEELKQIKSDNNVLTKKLNNAIKELDLSIEKFKSGSYPMQNSTLPYAGMDYGSVALFAHNVLGTKDGIIQQPNTINKINKVSNDIEKYFGNVKLQKQPTWDYFAGYPFVNASRNQLLYNVVPSMLGSSTGLVHNIDQNFWRTIDWYNGNVIADHGAEFNNEPRSRFYGLAYENLVPCDIIGGASGSLVVNDSNLPVGLLFGHNHKQPLIDKENAQVQLEKALTVGYALNMPFYSSNINGYVQPYNVIDGTDKTKYSHQVNSYRETLAKVYGSNYQTALFK
ncbi:MIP family Ig-specific serine endopeptidase [Mycoplasma sp. AA7A]|uniref:MIP family Ig-specific serine endopeptidase n=1 Tax=unclassified Mycoplasma TaxID=2683645 RepID=UPI003AAD66A5